MIISVLIISQFVIDDNNPPVSVFDLTCDTETVLTNQDFVCTVSGSQSIIGYIWDFHDNFEMEFLPYNETRLNHSYESPGSYLISVIGLRLCPLSTGE